ncbi:transporter substrate-binding domain-containing protein [Agarivorans sp. TSD2052]|uniref:transglycosylase SLT domain-containing protein n=1 Tax=Agarivorans sp. TSD2052 TaxID=2937286 RepID=UPI00200D2DD9|nr:transporter substrate-binding domain-containing protein [Agarivorans sp. TSD2052]UPW19966.1 transporter substrate-binding domain-containing protein [Agarivorans sp. TSD2052]
MRLTLPYRLSRYLILLTSILSLSLGLSHATEAKSSAADTEQDSDLLHFPYYIQQSFTGDLADIKQRKIVRALVTYGKSDFHLADGRPLGIQIELLRLYEEFLNKGIRRDVEKTKVKIVPVHFDQLIPALEAGRGDIVAAFLTATPERKKQLRFALGNAEGISEVLVSHKDTAKPEQWAELSGQKVYVMDGSSYVEHLDRLNLTLKRQGVKPIKVVEADGNLLSEDILEMVNAGVMKYTVIDDYKAHLWEKVFKDIRVDNHLTTSEGQSLGWAVRKTNPQLQKNLQEFVNKQVKQGSLLGNTLLNRYFDHTAWINRLANSEDRNRFNRYAPLFKKYASEYEFDYLAIVAQGYQESGLDNSKVSHRGAKGIMQLLPSTAKEMGYNNLDDPEQNIAAGIKYLAWLREHYINQHDIEDSERMALIWAAYNAGPSKMNKMRRLTKEMNLDPNVWFGNVEIAAGKIIGKETVRYVSNVYKYYIAYTMALELEVERAEE